MQRTITDDLEALLHALPAHIVRPLVALPDRSDLLEVVMDLGRPPEARFPSHEVVLSDIDITDEHLDYVVGRIGEFGDDNRAGIERTLHRISCLRNRRGRIVGLTCRVGRAVYGTIGIIRDLVESGQSILLVGRPGVGKTTMLREVARVLADDLEKRVIIVDTSNEIAGDGDIPHPAIGRARRMQVPTPTMQHAVMIEAVENHMPEVIVIDEIGTELEAQAARTIAERGVQLVGTAHGNTLENLMMNPTLSDLIGGIQSVTLSDEEARRRGTQKSILERKAPPTFDVCVEIQSWQRVAVHPDVGETVDATLRGYDVQAEVRELDEAGAIRVAQRAGLAGGRRGRREPGMVGGLPTRTNGYAARAELGGARPEPEGGFPRRVYPFGISRNRLQQAVKDLRADVSLIDALEGAEAVLTLRSYYRRKPQTLRDAEARGIPIYVLKSNTVIQMEQVLLSMRQQPGGAEVDPVTAAMQEAEEAVGEVLQGNEQLVELSPQNSYIRRLQHQIAQRYNLASRSRGREPYRRVLIGRDEGDMAPF